MNNRVRWESPLTPLTVGVGWSGLPLTGASRVLLAPPTGSPHRLTGLWGSGTSGPLPHAWLVLPVGLPLGPFVHPTGVPLDVRE